MKEDLLNIINTYGIMPQLKYFQSEVFELNEAIFDYENTYYEPYFDIYEDRNISEEEQKKHLKEHIAEEIADVQVMLNQFKEYYGITNREIEEVMKYKVERQLERISRGE